MISEDQIQIIFKNWCDKQEFIALHWHVPNGMSSNSKEGARFKRLGLKKGIPDYWVLLKSGKLLVIEFKKPGGVISKEQREILSILTSLNITNNVCYSAHEAVLFVKENL